MNKALALGPYSPVARPVEAFHIVDEHNMMVTENIRGNRAGEGDSHGNNFITYLLYNKVKHVLASGDLWYREDGEIVGQRHPHVSIEDHPMSRDHYINTLLSLKLNSQRSDIQYLYLTMIAIITKTGWKISKMARKTLSLHLWSHAIIGNKVAEWFFYLTEILTVALFYIPIHKLGSWITGYGDEVEQEDWIPYPEGERLQDLPKYKQVISKIIFPSYALTHAGFQLYVLKNYPRMRRLLKRLNLQMVGKTNYVQQMLFGKKNIPRDKVEMFEAMIGGRWSGYLSSRNDRNMNILDPQPKYNNLDVDLVRFLYNETQL